MEQETTTPTNQQPNPPEVDWKVKRATTVKEFLTSFPGMMSIIGGVFLLIVIIVFVIPSSRYAIMGVFVKKDVNVTVVSDVTGKPVSDAWVAIGEYGGYTDANGEVNVKNVAVGDYVMSSDKKYFESSVKKNYNVPISGKTKSVQLTLHPLGRSVNIALKNKVDLTAVPNAKIALGGTTAIADQKGYATAILKANDIDIVGKVMGKIEAPGYEVNQFEFNNEDADNQALNIGMTPSDNLYYISRYTGNVDVMATKLDGSNKQVVLGGTGKESDADTQAIGSKDWQYLALVSKRDNSAPKLYGIRTSDKKLTTIEGSNVQYDLVGWIGHKLIYYTHAGGSNWNKKQNALKSYNADTGESITIDETDAAGSNQNDYASEQFTVAVIMNDKIVYGKYWNYGPAPNEPEKNQLRLLSVDATGNNKNRIKESVASPGSSVGLKLESPNSLVVSWSGEYYRYDGKNIILDKEINDASYKTPAVRYIPSPDGKKWLWSEGPAGKQVVKVGTLNEKEEPHVVGIGNFSAYGWVTDNYIILSRGDNEIFALADDGVFSAQVLPLRTTEYQKPTVKNPNYGTIYGLY